jgi:2-(1,2-epoxy-1,2-dihydrophenyl)acetyl-CoA isomerase
VEGDLSPGANAENAEMPYETTLYDLAGYVATITINRPQVMNALSLSAVDELLDAFGRAEQEARAVLFTGTGKGFCTGADITGSDPRDKEKLGGGAGAMLRSHYNALVLKILHLEIPVVAAVNGTAAGGGSSFALASDFVVMARSASFVQAFVRQAIVPDAGATWLLPRLVGRQRATALMMLGERLNAEQALAWGMVHQVVDEAELMGTARALAERLAAGPTAALKAMKGAINRSFDQGLEASLELEADLQDANAKTEDLMEGVRAFMEKRKPNYKGK